MGQVFNTVLQVSVSASVLCVLLLCVRLLAGRRPGVLLPLLGVLLIVRLAVPINIPSPLSVMNIFSGLELRPAITVYAPGTEPPAGVVQETGNISENVELINTDNNNPGEAEAAQLKNSGARQEEASPIVPLGTIASYVWLSGAVLFLACLVLSNVRFAALLKKNRTYNAPGFRELLAACKEESGLRERIEVIQYSGINTSAVYGIIRPKLLISPSFGWLSNQEKENVLMHELAHIKRRDTLKCLFITLINIVYWFNPLVWAALALIRGDLEVMCDMAVLKKTGDRRGYALTLVNLARCKYAPKPRLVTALFISTDSIKRRIRMITRYKKNSALFTAAAVILAITIAVTGCTGAAPEAAASPTASPAVSQSAQPDGTEGGAVSEGQELLLEYRLDISSLPANEARTANIEKAIALIDGTVFPAADETQTDANLKYKWVDLNTSLGDMTEDAGWQYAPAPDTRTLEGAVGWSWVMSSESGVKEYANKDPQAFANDIAGAETTDEAGGGAELVMLAASKAVLFSGMTKFIGCTPQMVVYSYDEEGSVESPSVSGDFAYSEVTVTISDEGEVSDERYVTFNAPAVSGMYVYNEDTYTSLDLAGFTAGIGVGAMNDISADDLILRVSLQDGILTAAIYAAGDTAQNTRARSRNEYGVISAYSLDYGRHMSEGTLFNVEKALSMLDGQTIKPGEELSVNAVLGVRNAENGWKEAPGIEDGEYNANYGTGVCAVSTALYNAAIRAELTVPDVTRHSIMPDYVSGGLDATISSSGPDLVIANPYESDVTIKARLENGKDIVIGIYGPPLGYTVDFTSTAAGETAPPEPRTVYNTATAPDGTAIAEGGSYTMFESRGGRTFEVYKTKYDNEGNIMEGPALFLSVQYPGFEGTVYVNGPESD